MDLEFPGLSDTTVILHMGEMHYVCRETKGYVEAWKKYTYCVPGIKLTLKDVHLQFSIP